MGSVIIRRARRATVGESPTQISDNGAKCLDLNVGCLPDRRAAIGRVEGAGTEADGVRDGRTAQGLESFWEFRTQIFPAVRGNPFLASRLVVFPDLSNRELRIGIWTGSWKLAAPWSTLFRVAPALPADLIPSPFVSTHYGTRCVDQVSRS